MCRKRAIFITGSGKCGSSVIAHSFFAAGFPMGEIQDLVIHEGAVGNIRGYWEHARVLQINRDILEFNNADWDRFPHLPLRLNDDLRAQMRELAETVPDGFCCKEPRLVWTVELWAECFPDFTLVVPFRNPAGFVRSIAFKWPEKYSADRALSDSDSNELRIWEVSNRRLLALSRNVTAHWICFDDPIPVFENRLGEIIRSLGKTMNTEAFYRFFIPAERRFSSEEDIIFSTSALPQRIRDLYAELRTLSR